jgi:hypothetical protein
MPVPIDHPAQNGGPFSLQAPTSPQSFAHSTLLQECLAEWEEILRLKWIESEKAGRDIGSNAAVVRWVVRHRRGWRLAYRRVRRAC